MVSYKPYPPGNEGIELIYLPIAFAAVVFVVTCINILYGGCSAERASYSPRKSISIPSEQRFAESELPTIIGAETSEQR